MNVYDYNENIKIIQEKPSIETVVAYLKTNIQGCYVGDAEIADLKILYPNVSYKDLRRVFYEAINKKPMQPVSYMTRRLRVLKPESDPFNTQVRSYSNTGRRIEKGIDWQARYAEIRDKRVQEEQQYDQQHGTGSWRKKQDQECQQVHLGFVELEKHTTTPQQGETKSYYFRSDKAKAWYNNLIQGVCDEMNAEAQRRKKERQKELAKKQERAEVRRELKKLAKNV